MSPDTDKNYFGASAFNSLKNVANVAREVMTGETQKEEQTPEEPQTEVQKSEPEDKVILKESDNG
jgi:hypothetical protein|tara:strand:- start:35 stop:229 length:195 start_codon:yes stop_codon:yes gene_type:complete